jgi:hypothetical protein
MSFFVVSQPHKYSAHYVKNEHGSMGKKNCHEIACPYCEGGSKAKDGLYVMILDDLGKLSYFDISIGLYKEMSKRAKIHCAETNVEFTGMGEFLENRMVTIVKCAGQEGMFSGYTIDYADVHDEDVGRIRAKLDDHNTKLGREFRILTIGFQELVRPGSLEEDGGVVYV